MEQDKNTEQRIIDAAQKIFQVKGLAGARMQEIADEAGINKAMLHYYFRTKDKLFDHIFKIAANILFPKVLIVLNTNSRLEDKIKNFVIEYITFIKAHPYLPQFILQELSNTPDRIIDIMAGVKSKYNLELFQNQIDTEVE
jgi:TetR/AcrR family transcriptional regulator